VHGELQQSRRAAAAIVLALATLSTAVSLLIADVALERLPHVTDGVSYLFQAKIFAAGRLFLPPPPEPLLFVHENILVDATRWCSIYSPGWPLLLALGELVGASWVVNPLLFGLAVIGAWRLGSSLHDTPTGLLAAAALAVSPFGLLMSADVMAHTPALCAGVWCLGLLAEARTSPRPAMVLVAAGLLGGWMFLIRPSSALALLLPAVIWLLVALARRGAGWAAVGWLGVGSLPCAVGLLAYDQIVFGGVFVNGYQLYEPARFGSVGAMAVSPLEALTANLPWYVANLNRSLWGLPWPDLLTFLPLLWPQPRRRLDVLLAACAGSLILGHSFYYYRDVVYSGPRFAFEALGPLAVLAARSVLTVAVAVRQLTAGLGSAQRPLRLALAGAGAVTLLVWPLGVRLPQQILAHSGWYLAVSGEPLRRAAAAGVGPEALVFVGGTGWYYSALFLANEIPPGGRPRVFVRDIPPLRSAALRLYARREVWQLTVSVEIPDPDGAPGVARPLDISWARLR
jgi:hypothetical protein